MQERSPGAAVLSVPGRELGLVEQRDGFKNVLPLTERETAMRRQQEYRSRQPFSFRTVAGVPVGARRFGRVEIDQARADLAAPQPGDAADGGFLRRGTDRQQPVVPLPVAGFGGDVPSLRQ